MSIWLLVLAGMIGFLTMFVGAISGGVGLVLRPMLILLGFPVTTIIGTARTSGYLGNLPGVYILAEKKKIDWKLALFLSIPVFVGTALAVYVTLFALKNSFNTFFGILLLVAGTLLILNKRLGMKTEKKQFSPVLQHSIAFVGTVVIAFFGTFTGGLGPLYGSFYLWIYGKSYITSSALWQVASYVGGGLAAIGFIVGGVVDWHLFIALSIGLMLGSYFGTHFALKKGESWVRGVVIVVVFATALKLLFF